jgi:hypothetical protein
MYTKISDKLWTLVKTSRLRGYEIAYRAGVHPATLSKLLWQRVKPNDPRVLSVGTVLGLRPEECFREIEAASDGEMEMERK